MSAKDWGLVIAISLVLGALEIMSFLAVAYRDRGPDLYRVRVIVESRVIGGSVDDVIDGGVINE
jgi:hypothetical protein